MQTLPIEIVQQILLLMPYRDCLKLAKTSKHFYSIFTSCYYHSAKIEDIDHWMKFLMTGYIPPALKVPSYTGNYNLEVKDGLLIKLHLFDKRLTSIPNSVGNLVNLTILYFYIIKVFGGQSVDVFAGFYRKSGEFKAFVLCYYSDICGKIS